MRRLLLLPGLIGVTLMATGCTPFLGAHTKHFSHAGVDYTKCIIVVDRSHPELAQHALDVCKDAISQGPMPARH